MKNVKEVLPWWFKIGAKIVLARLPIPYAYWKRMGLFEHGDMNQSQRALDTFLEHARTSGILNWNGSVPHFQSPGKDCTVLELGPGDSLFTAVIARAFGASKTWLVDSGSFAAMTMEPYSELINYLRQKGYSVDWASRPGSLKDLLEACKARYMTEGVRSLANVPSHSVDICLSNAVLEHIPKGDFELLVTELCRVMKSDGVGVHRVDLKDHLEGGLNNLRFGDSTWEGTLFRTSGFYTNRIRFRRMIGLFERAGFDCQVPRLLRWDSMPTPREKLDPAFRCLSDEDLLVSGFDLVLRRKR